MCVQEHFLPTTVWKHECSCVRKGGFSCWARTLFSTIVHSTSSSWITTSFFKIFIAYSSSVVLISASMTLTDTDRGNDNGWKSTIQLSFLVPLVLCFVTSDTRYFFNRRRIKSFKPTLPKLPFPSTARKEKSLSLTWSKLL